MSQYHATFDDNFCGSTSRLPPLRIGTKESVIFLEIANVLHAQDIKRLRDHAAQLEFVDGKLSNPHNKTKNNLQADTRHAAYRDSAKLMLEALQSTREFSDFAIPLKVAPPLLCKYEKGMEYGVHSDMAYVTVEGSRLRSDVSCTIFISEPEDYEGGELRIQLGSKRMKVKGKAGSAIVYPSTMLHEVRPVISGERLVAITFIESLVPNQQQREILYELGEVAALEGNSMKWQNRTRLESVRNNLLRLWSS